MMQTPAVIMDPPTTSVKPKVTSRKLVLDAIRQLKSTKGSSFADIKKFVSSKNELSDAADVKSMKTFVKNAVDQGILMKVDGKYKIKEAAGRKRSKSKSPARRRRKSGSPRRKTRPRKPSAGKKTRKASQSRKKRVPRKSLPRKPSAGKKTRKPSQPKKKGLPRKSLPRKPA